MPKTLKHQAPFGESLATAFHPLRTLPAIDPKQTFSVAQLTTMNPCSKWRGGAGSEPVRLRPVHLRNAAAMIGGFSGFSTAPLPLRAAPGATGL